MLHYRLSEKAFKKNQSQQPFMIRVYQSICYYSLSTAELQKGWPSDLLLKLEQRSFLLDGNCSLVAMSEIDYYSHRIGDINKRRNSETRSFCAWYLLNLAVFFRRFKARARWPSWRHRAGQPVFRSRGIRESLGPSRESRGMRDQSESSSLELHDFSAQSNFRTVCKLAIIWILPRLGLWALSTWLGMSDLFSAACLKYLRKSKGEKTEFLDSWPEKKRPEMNAHNENQA